MKTPTILSGHSSLTVNDEQAPPHKSERRPLKRIFAMLGNTPQIIAPSCTYGMWMASVDINAPDLIPQCTRRWQIYLWITTEAQFRILFARCACSHYSTARAFKHHVCVREVIDSSDRRNLWSHWGKPDSGRSCSWERAPRSKIPDAQILLKLCGCREGA